MRCANWPSWFVARWSRFACARWRTCKMKKLTPFDVLRRSRRRRSSVLKEVKELRIDLARLSDELSNITKFFGDWHLARVYESVSARFHLGDWHRAVDEKLKTLHDLYQVLNHDQNNQWMLLLEVMIVLLFVIHLVMLFL